MKWSQSATPRFDISQLGGCRSRRRRGGRFHVVSLTLQQRTQRRSLPNARVRQTTKHKPDRVRAITLPLRRRFRRAPAHAVPTAREVPAAPADAPLREDRTHRPDRAPDARGAIAISNGDTLYLDPCTWSNTGTITVDAGSALHLGARIGHSDQRGAVPIQTSLSLLERAQSLSRRELFLSRL
jgi:hypothetical protein